METTQSQREALNAELAELREFVDTFEPSDYIDESEYDEMLDDCYGTVSIAGMEYDTSQALRELDPIAYRCGYSDFCDIDEDECADRFPEYAEAIERIEEIEDELSDLDDEAEEEE